MAFKVLDLSYCEGDTSLRHFDNCDKIESELHILQRRGIHQWTLPCNLLVEIGYTVPVSFAFLGFPRDL